MSSSHHLKRLNAPRTLRLHRKEKTWTIRSSPGPHELNASIPLGLLVRDYFQLCDTRREVKRILANGEILVDGIIRKSNKFPIGFMDVITIPKTKKHYRLVFDQRGKLSLVSISTNDAEWKLRRIENKTTLRGKKTQLHFHDGNNMIVEKDTYHTGDVLKMAFKDKKINDIYPKEKGTISLITGGSHVGELATIESIEIIQSSSSNLAVMKGGNDFTTYEKYVFPVGKTKPVIAIPEVKIQ
jgi:small subunit ribosomal protein S4e